MVGAMSSLIIVVLLGFGIFLMASLLLTALALGISSILRCCVFLFRESNHTHTEYEAEPWLFTDKHDTPTGISEKKAG